MADKLSYTGTIFDASRQDTVTPETNQSSRQFFHEDVRTLLRNASVPMEFKLSMQGILPDPGLSSFTSLNAYAAVGEAYLPVQEIMCQEPASLSTVSEKPTQPFYLTDAMVNLAGLEYITPGLQRFDGCLLSVLVTNTYFLEPCFYPPVYWCQMPKKKRCSGMYVSYAIGSEKLTIDVLLNKMKDCKLFAKLEPGNQWCGERRCCRQVGVEGGGKVAHRRVVLTNNPAVPKHMARIAAMINGKLTPNKRKKSAFCLAITDKLGNDIDRFADSKPVRKVDAQFNPGLLPGPEGTQAYDASATMDPTSPDEQTAYLRTGCDLLAHVIAESFWGNNCSRTENYLYAHKQALFEENWIRRNTNRSPMLWKASPKGVVPEGLPLRKENKEKMKEFDRKLMNAK